MISLFSLEMQIISTNMNTYIPIKYEYEYENQCSRGFRLMYKNILISSQMSDLFGIKYVLK